MYPEASVTDWISGGLAAVGGITYVATRRKCLPISVIKNGLSGGAPRRAIENVSVISVLCFHIYHRPNSRFRIDAFYNNGTRTRDCVVVCSHRCGGLW